MKKITVLWIIILLVCTAAFWNAVYDGRTRKANHRTQQITDAEVDFLNQELNRRYADDCTIERTWYGFKCVEFKTGKIYKIYM
ncbi:MAG: hypothetical protein PHD63_06160 [Candidatus Marinimicrobia bacterium]|nr:hypothetical protein [Candidatus Neomarinimicrobiota bacterium]